MSRAGSGKRRSAWLTGLGVAIVLAHAIAARIEFGVVEPGLLLPYALALLPPLASLRTAAPGTGDRLGGLGLIVMQAILGVGPMVVLDPMEAGFGRWVIDLLSAAAVIGIGLLTLVVLVARLFAPRR